jgi:hypothetical protein
MNGLYLYSEVPLGQNNRLVPIDIELEPKANVRIKLLLILGRVKVPFPVDIMSATLVVHHLQNTKLSCWVRRTGWPQHKLSKRVQGDVVIIIKVIVRCMSLLGTGTMTLISGSTRSS